MTVVDDDGQLTLEVFDSTPKRELVEPVVEERKNAEVELNKMGAELSKIERQVHGEPAMGAGEFLDLSRKQKRLLITARLKNLESELEERLAESEEPDPWFGYDNRGYESDTWGIE